MYIHTNQFPQARAEFEHVLSLDPTNAAARELLPMLPAR
jgi:hypothetical protein